MVIRLYEFSLSVVSPIAIYYMSPYIREETNILKSIKLGNQINGYFKNYSAMIFLVCYIKHIILKLKLSVITRNRVNYWNFSYFQLIQGNYIDFTLIYMAMECTLEYSASPISRYHHYNHSANCVLCRKQTSSRRFKINLFCSVEFTDVLFNHRSIWWPFYYSLLFII